MDHLLEKMLATVPHPRQLAWQELEFTAFLHFGMNTFTNREWGDGTEDPALFNPQGLNTDQWCESFLLAGIKGCIITAKHHDGFCLWDTQYTEHCVRNSPYQKDVVAQLAASCRKYGLKFGIYLSPWDRHESSYGFGEAYNDYFCGQLTELLSNYGEIYTVWFDGACGEGTNGKKQGYDWKRFYALIRRLQPNAVISVCGPDVRWCGNEAGSCRSAEWSVVPEYLCDNEKVHENSQQEDNTAFRKKKLASGDEDLGSREVLAGADALIWYPAEVDTSIRPGWFYHPEEDCKVRPLEELQDIYFNSVGGNSVLLLNIPPDKNGLISEFDRARLAELGGFIRDTFAENFCEEAQLQASSEHKECKAFHVRTRDGGFWMPSEEADSYELYLTFSRDLPVRFVVLMEQLEKSQRVEAYSVFAKNSENWVRVFGGETIGYQKICVLEQPVVSREWKLVIHRARSCPAIRHLGMF